MTTPLPSRTLPDLAAATSKLSQASPLRSVSATPFKALLQDHVVATPSRTTPATATPGGHATGPTRTPERPAAKHVTPSTTKPATPPSKPEATEDGPEETAAAQAGATETHSARLARAARAAQAQGRADDARADANEDASTAATPDLSDPVTTADALASEAASTSDPASSTAAPVDPGQALLQAWLGWTPPRPDVPGKLGSRVEGDALVPEGTDALASTSTARGWVESARPDDGTTVDRNVGVQDMLSLAGLPFIPGSESRSTTKDVLSGPEAATAASAVDGLDAPSAVGAPSATLTTPTPSTGPSAAPGPELSLGRGPQDADFAQTFALQVQNLARDGVQEATLHLHPVDLGSIAVQITLDGPQAQVDFAATQASTRELLQAHIGDLAAALQSAGLDYRGGEVRDGNASPDKDPSRREGRGQAGLRTPGPDEAGAPSVTLQGVARPSGRLDLYA